MGDWIGGLIQESLDQYRMAWQLMAAAKGGIVEEDEYFSYAIAHTSYPMFNVAFFKRPPQSNEELLHFSRLTQEKFLNAGVRGTFTLPSSWLPREGMDALESAGFVIDVKTMGMRTAHLNDPLRRTPVIRPIEGDEASSIMAAVNAEAYGFPGMHDEIAMQSFWTDPVRAYVIEETGQPAAVGAVVTQNGIAYMMWFATCSPFRGKGYAQAILHRAWADAKEQDGAKLTVLHATSMGRPVYHKLGYTAIAEFPCFISVDSVAT